MKEWDDVTIRQLLFGAGTAADRPEWLSRRTASFVLYLGQLQQSLLQRNPLLSLIPPIYLPNVS